MDQIDSIRRPTKENLNELLFRYESLDKYWSDRKLNIIQIIKLKIILMVLIILKYTYLPIRIAIEEIPELFDDVKIRNLEMKAGEAVIFSSMNVHGSFPNISDNSRFAFVGRYIPNDVQLYKDAKYDYYQFPNSKIKFKVENIACIQVLGEDKFGFNRITEQPLNEKQQKI